MKQGLLNGLFGFGLVAAQIVAIFFYGFYFKHTLPSEEIPSAMVASKLGLYPYFQDIHVMIFVGFGFLLTSFHKFRLTSLTNCFWVAAITVQFYFLWNALWEGVFAGHRVKEIRVDTSKLIYGEVSAGAILIAVCAIVGKVNSFQYLIISLVGTCLYCLNEVIVTSKHSLGCYDVGGAMIIHTFGAFYGIGLTWMLQYREMNSENLFETHDSLSLAMVGTLFLWCFWPSFNGALAASPAEIHMAVLNTYFSIIGSCVFAYATSLFIGNGKFKMSQILNATLAGGVAMGSCADILHDGYVAYICGCGIGIISTLLFEYAPKMLKAMKIHDVAGVFNLHGVPGIIGGLLAAIFRAKYIDNKGGNQVAGTFISVGIGLFGGAIVGILVKGFHFYEKENHYFNDRKNVLLEEFVEANLKMYGHGAHDQPAGAPAVTNGPLFSERQDLKK